ncbi:hypothetical protein P3T76_004161 [Phytophthora citrophthora]|uniref:Uncharacterized protein n=1 Tax=Phytophthora citrophthora TaxID=4793 RepID=A0AAD9GSH4_9STRA|nr:hypothetical protein P3T76_004161 [Phytophthora citrophthora]
MDYQRIEQEVATLAPRLDVMTGSLNAEDVEKGLALLEEVDKYLALCICLDTYRADKTNIVVLGTSGAGKSAVVSFLFGEGRIVVRHESKSSRVLVTKIPLHSVSISSGAVSTALLPAVSLVTLEEEPVSVWDMPESPDTRGPFVELVVHYIYRWMLKDDKNLKFIIVSPPPSNDRKLWPWRR